MACALSAVDEVCLVMPAHVKNVPATNGRERLSVAAVFARGAGLSRASFRLSVGVRGAVADALPGESGGMAAVHLAADRRGAGDTEP